MASELHSFDLQQAATFLHMSPAVLRQKAKAGHIKAAKPGKCWVFLPSDLVAYLDALYAHRGQTPLSGCDQEVTLCHSTNAVRSGGSASRAPTASEYANRLGLVIGDKRRNTTTT